jgi:hypothetical protein
MGSYVVNVIFHLLGSYFIGSQGHLLEIHLLESRLLDTIFQNVICSTTKLSSARQQSLTFLCVCLYIKIIFICFLSNATAMYNIYINKKRQTHTHTIIIKNIKRVVADSLIILGGRTEMSILATSRPRQVKD